MWNTNLLRQALLATACVAAAAFAIAEPGDTAEVSKARKDYAQAMRGHDRGLQNAMRVELSYQLAKAKEQAKRKAGARVKHPPATGSPPG